MVEVLNDQMFPAAIPSFVSSALILLVEFLLVNTRAQ